MRNITQKSLQRLFILTALSMTVAACTAPKKEDLKSPCVGAEGSPCDRRPVNDWWMA